MEELIRGRIALRLRIARKGAGLSQRKLAKKMGLSDVTICDLEKARRKVDIVILKKLAHVLDKPLEWFLEEAPESPRPPSAVITELERFLKSYVPVYSSLKKLAEADAVDHILISRDDMIPDRYKAFRIDGLQLEPSILDGDTLVVDTTLDPHQGDIVICTWNGLPAVAMFSTDGQKSWLQTHTEFYPLPKCEIVGVVVELIRKIK